METQRKTKRPVYKRVWFWLLLSPAILAIFFIFAAVVIGMIQGIGEVINGRNDIATQDTTQAVMSTAMTTPQPTYTPTITSTKATKPTLTPTSSAVPTKTPQLTPKPTIPPTPTPTIAPTKTPKPTSTLTPKPTIKPTPTTRPTPTPSPTIDPAEAPYGVDINGNPGPDFIALISYFEYWLESYIGEDVKISPFQEDWYIRKGNFSYVLSTRCWIPIKAYDIIMKIEFDETYENYVVYQLKINGINIDL